MRASKLLTRSHHTYGPEGWQGILSRDDAEAIGSLLACAYAETKQGKRGGEEHQRLVRKIVEACKAGDAFLCGDDARTMMSAFRAAYDDSLDYFAREEETLRTGAKVYPVKSWKQRLLAAFKRTFPKGNLFDVQAVAR